MRHRIAVVLAAVAFSVLTLPGIATAAVATTGGSRVVSATSAIVYGVADPTNSDSAWLFQYGTTKAYGKTTLPRALHKGPSGALWAALNHLAPQTTYHYRLVVEQGSEPTTAKYGADYTFTTAPSTYSAAITSPAGSVTRSSAVLHGIANPLDAHAAWTFEYASNASFHGPKITRWATVGSGLSVVQALVKRLSVHTTYYFRLIVAQGFNPTIYTAGKTLRFTTAASGHGPSFGKASLGSHRLSVRTGVVSIPIACKGAGGARCQGRVSITAGKGVACGGRHFSTTAGGTHVVTTAVGSACEALLRKAKAHKLHATLKATFSSSQGPLSAAVTLVGT